MIFPVLGDEEMIFPDRLETGGGMNNSWDQGISV